MITAAGWVVRGFLLLAWLVSSVIALRYGIEAMRSMPLGGPSLIVEARFGVAFLTAVVAAGFLAVLLEKD